MRTAFISGHIDVDILFFNKYYKEKIDEAIKNNDKFIIGDARGIDKLAFEYILSKYSKDNITVYVYFPTNIEKYKKIGVNIIFNKYKNITERDNLMTRNSDYDIAYTRTPEEQKLLYKEKYNASRISGTEKNILRRKHNLILSQKRQK